jgi:hypothetical protein
MKNLYKTLIISFLSISTFAQQASEIDPKFVKLPRYADLTAINAAISSPDKGMMVYNLSTKSSWYHDGITWKDMYVSGVSVPNPLYLNSNSTTITGVTNAEDEAGLMGINTTSGVGSAVLGRATSTSPDEHTVGIKGENLSTNAMGYGVHGKHDGTGWAGYFEGVNALKVDGHASIANSSWLEFGKGLTKQEDNGKIAYNAFGEANTLSIVGGGVETDGSDRKIKLWANGGTELTGSIRMPGEIKPNGISGLPNQVLTSTGNGSMKWADQASNSNEELAGNGTWGDCSSNNITAYQPVVNEAPTHGIEFGKSVAISGTMAVVSEPNYDKKIHIYYFDKVWTLAQSIDPPVNANQFGYSLATDGQTIIVGSPYYSQVSPSGTPVTDEFVYVYTFNGSTWVLSQTLNAPDLHFGDFFGSSVAMSGDFLVVGAPFGEATATINNRGCAYIYKKTGGTYSFLQKIGTSLYIDFTETAPQFGYSVAISGQTLLVGTPFVSNTNHGIVEKFTFNGTIWSRIAPISNFPYSSNDYCGKSIAMSGNDSAIGVPGKYSTVANRGMVMINATSIYGGGGVQEIICPVNVEDTGFGEAISMDGNLLIIGAPNLRKSFIYQKLGTKWNLVQEVTDPITDGNFGCSLGISSASRRFIVGSSNYNSNVGKATFGKLK